MRMGKDEVGICGEKQRLPAVVVAGGLEPK